MMDVDLSLNYEGRPLSVLSRLIEERGRLLNETTRDAVTATTITVLRSLRADTRIAPKSAPLSSFTVEDTGWVGGWQKEGGKWHRVPRVSSARHAARVAGIHPVNLAGQRYESGERVRVYRVTPVNDQSAAWDRTKHRGCWYVFAQSERVAREFGKRHMTRRIQRYRGLAKSTLGFAMARVSTRNSNFAADVRSAKARRAAQSAAQVFRSVGDGTSSITVRDALSYSMAAMRSGAGGLARAMMKAANSIAGRLSKVASARLMDPISTPFPEVLG